MNNTSENTQDYGVFWRVLVLFVGLGVLMAVMLSGNSSAQEATPEVAPEVRVVFVTPADNAIVLPTFTVQMMAVGLTVEPAGEVREGAGHFHIMIDQPFIEAGQQIPNDDSHRHFGTGATEAELTLTPGSHTLRLQFANGEHIAQDGDQYRAELHVRVSDSAPEQAIYFLMPTDGATVPPTFNALWSASGFVVEPAGEVRDGAGHFHVLIDEPFIAAGEVIPNDETHRHFGKAQLSTELTLTPGEHTLRLQLANGAHIALDNEATHAEIHVNVVEGAPAQQVMFVTPEDGATVSSPVTLKWAAVGLLIEPAGQVRDGAGHLHVMIDEPFIETGSVIPNDETHRHFGGAQLGAELELTPGRHTLRLQMANGAHIALDGDQYRDEITVTVE